MPLLSNSPLLSLPNKDTETGKKDANVNVVV